MPAGVAPQQQAERGKAAKKVGKGKEKEKEKKRQQKQKCKKAEMLSEAKAGVCCLVWYTDARSFSF